MPMMRFAQRLTGDFNVKVKTLIKIEPTNINDATNNNSGVVTTDPVFSRVDFSTIGSFKRYVSPFKLLNIPATHSTARIILTSNVIPTVFLFEFISFLLLISLNLLNFIVVSHSYHYIPLFVAFIHIPVSFDHLFQ